jgi:hypothetical protein
MNGKIALIPDGLLSKCGDILAHRTHLTGHLLSAQIYPPQAENPHVSALHRLQVHDREPTEVPLSGGCGGALRRRAIARRTSSAGECSSRPSTTQVR